MLTFIEVTGSQIKYYLVIRLDVGDSSNILPITYIVKGDCTKYVALYYGGQFPIYNMYFITSNVHKGHQLSIIFVITGVYLEGIGNIILPIKHPLM
jgi:hypothetical protein